jgi:hypothetical protein
MSALHVSEIRFLPATAIERATGLLGFVSFLINDGLRLDGVTVRRTLAGAFCLSWPTRMDRLGAKHALIRPITDEARRDLEAQVLGALGIGTGLATPVAPTGQTEGAP